MLLNFASDVPFVYKNDNFTFFEKKNFETQLPNYLYEQDNIEELYIITWPWNFSTTRIGTEVINILLYLKKVQNVYYLNKLEFFNALWYENIYLFSWNKNKFLYLKQNKDYEIISRNDIKIWKSEQIFEERNNLDIEHINYENILKNYKKLDWNKENKQLDVFYIFNPIVW